MIKFKIQDLTLLATQDLTLLATIRIILLPLEAKFLGSRSVCGFPRLIL